VYLVLGKGQVEAKCSGAPGGFSESTVAVQLQSRGSLRLCRRSYPGLPGAAEIGPTRYRRLGCFGADLTNPDQDYDARSGLYCRLCPPLTFASGTETGSTTTCRAWPKAGVCRSCWRPLKPICPAAYRLGGQPNWPGSSLVPCQPHCTALGQIRNGDRGPRQERDRAMRHPTDRHRATHPLSSHSYAPEQREVCAGSTASTGQPASEDLTFASDLATTTCAVSPKGQLGSRSAGTI